MPKPRVNERGVRGAYHPAATHASQDGAVRRILDVERVHAVTSHDHAYEHESRDDGVVVLFPYSLHSALFSEEIRVGSEKE
jgi:hypothetical protein